MLWFTGQPIINPNKFKNGKNHQIPKLLSNWLACRCSRELWKSLPVGTLIVGPIRLRGNYSVRSHFLRVFLEISQSMRSSHEKPLATHVLCTAKTYLSQWSLLGLDRFPRLSRNISKLSMLFSPRASGRGHTLVLQRRICIRWPNVVPKTNTLWRMW